MCKYLGPCSVFVGGGSLTDGPCTCMALVFIVCGSAHRSFSEHAAMAVWLRLDGRRHVGAGEWACLQHLRDACIEGWRLKLLKYKKVAAKGDWLRSVARQLPARGACDFLAQQTRDSMVVKIVGGRALGRGGAASAKVAYGPPSNRQLDMCHTWCVPGHPCDCGDAQEGLEITDALPTGQYCELPVLWWVLWAARTLQCPPL